MEIIFWNHPFENLLLVVEVQVFTSVDAFLISQRNLKVSNTKQRQNPYRHVRFLPTMGLALKKTHLPHASVSDPSLLEEISRSLWKKTGGNKLLSPARLK